MYIITVSAARYTIARLTLIASRIVAILSNPARPVIIDAINDITEDSLKVFIIVIPSVDLFRIYYNTEGVQMCGQHDFEVIK